MPIFGGPPSETFAIKGAAESDRMPRMEQPARQISLVPPPDRRQSETALAVARGTARLLRSLGFAPTWLR
jgi:hypothetical protein